MLIDDRYIQYTNNKCIKGMFSLTNRASINKK